MITLGAIGPWQIIIFLFFLAIPLMLVILLVKALKRNRADTTDCPYCGEVIMATAKKCKHCGEWLDNSSTTSA